MSSLAILPIGVFADRSDTPIETIRTYERLGLVARSRRAAQVLRPGSPHQGADRSRNGRSHRCVVRHRARPQRTVTRRAQARAAKSAAAR
ncbi:MAG: MerR family DNA-binding transcriptional regulator [Reyranella sp.]|nr:MerR family DNA-binding transcriptional regulator [Reyranella sp.]